MDTPTPFASFRSTVLGAALICVSAAAPAQTAPSQKEKAPAKQVKAAPAAKPKVRLMTREELRVCFQELADNQAESAAIEKEQAAFEQERAALVVGKDEFNTRNSGMNARATAVMAELEELKVEQAALAKPPEKSEMQAYEVRRLAFNARNDAHGKKVEAFNSDKREFDTQRLALDSRIEANNARGKGLKTRAETYNEALESYRVNCLNKPYDTDDEAAVRKDMQSAPK